MTVLTVQNTWSSGPTTHRINMRDMDLVSVGSGTVLYVTNGSTGGIVTYQVNASTGALTYNDALTLPALASVDGPAHLEPLNFGGQDYIVNLGRHADGLEAIRIGTGSNLDTRVDMAGTDGAGISSLIFHAADTRDVAYVSYWGNSDLGIYQVTSSGAMNLLGTINGAFDSQGADLTGFQVTQVQGQDVLVHASQEQNAVFSYTINVNGGIAIADVLRMSDGLPVATPTAMEIVESGDQRFAVLASSGTSSLTVMQISATGEMTLTDHINGSLHTRIESVVALETVSYADRHFVIAGGADDGVSLFQMLPDGRLYHIDAQEDLLSTSLSNITSITAQVRGTGIDIYVSSENEQGVTQLRYELGAQAAAQNGGAGDDVLTGNSSGYYLIGNAGDDTISGSDPFADSTSLGNFEGSAGADTLSGTAFDDTIRGNLGDDVLVGGEGDDILNGSNGADDLDGGVGSDWASYEGSRGSLRVDLMFSQINTNVAAGDVYTSIENLIGSQGFDNLRGTLSDNHIVGGRNVDYIFGRRGDDTLDGGIGDDVLFGGTGADVLIGGENRDRAQYSESLTAVTVDLTTTSNNTGEAIGDSYNSIEDLAGSRFDDDLRGDTGANRLFGREGADILNGREGNDYLNGGAHSDTLDGGAGNDVMRGGQHADTFVFREGNDLIEDFDTELDHLHLDPDLLGGGAITAERAVEFASVIGGHTVFDFGEDGQLTVENLTNPNALLDDISFL